MCNTLTCAGTLATSRSHLWEEGASWKQVSSGVSVLLTAEPAAGGLCKGDCVTQQVYVSAEKMLPSQCCLALGQRQQLLTSITSHVYLLNPARIQRSPVLTGKCHSLKTTGLTDSNTRAT